MQNNEEAGSVHSNELYKVLIVNDEIMTQIIIKAILEKSFKIPPENIIMVENGKQAIVKAVENQFDLIIMDLNMPVMGGFEATKKIREVTNT
jgi:CheY-like chemotaxis protein